MKENKNWINYLKNENEWDIETLKPVMKDDF
jgi:hypothetical protein